MKPIACVIGGKLMKYSNDPLPDECLLYPERQWYGLTDEERRDIREWQEIQKELGPVWAPMLLYLYLAIEAKLKEKNDIRK